MLTFAVRALELAEPIEAMINARGFPELASLDLTHQIQRHPPDKCELNARSPFSPKYQSAVSPRYPAWQKKDFPCLLMN
jgi:hypothetical protein